MKFVLPAALVAVLPLLSACGGGGSDETTLTGVVAVGAPLAGAPIEAWCAIDGVRVATGTTDGGGSYAIKVPQPCGGPWLLRTTQVTPIGEPMVVISQLPPPAGGGPVVIHSNITPLTTLLAQAQHQTTDIEEMLRKEMALKPKKLEEKMKEIEKQKQRMQQTLDHLSELMKRMAERLMTLEKIRDTPFLPKPGDVMDDLIEEFVKLRGEVTTEALLQHLRPPAGNLADGLPWKTLFGGKSTLTLTGADCVASGPAGGLTATLRMQGKELLVDMVSDTLGTRTLTVGAAVRSDFVLSVGQGVPYVHLYAYESGQGDLEVTTDGEPLLHFSMGASDASCKLSTPLLRADLVDFHVSNRILGAAPEGASGSCAASGIGPAFDYAITPLGDVRFDGASLPRDWLDRPDAIYFERLQYRAPGSGTSPSFQIHIGPAADRGIQPYYYHSVPYGVNSREYW